MGLTTVEMMSDPIFDCVPFAVTGAILFGQLTSYLIPPRTDYQGQSGGQIHAAKDA